jgi:hypothetical protein
LDGYYHYSPVTVVVRSQAYVCGCFPAEIVGSNPTRAWMFVCCECYVLSGRGLCDEQITRPDESYQMWCVVVCELETLCMRRPCSMGAVAPIKQIIIIIQRHFKCFRPWKVGYCFLSIEGNMGN